MDNLNITSIFSKRSKKEYFSTLGPKLILINDSFSTKDKDTIFDSPRGRSFLSTCFKSKFKAAETHVTYINDINCDVSFTVNILPELLRYYFKNGTLDFNKLVIGFVGQKAFDLFCKDYEKNQWFVPNIFYMINQTKKVITFSDDAIDLTNRFEIPYVILPSIEERIDTVIDILNESSVGKAIEKSPYVSTIDIINKFNDIIELYNKEIICGFKFDAILKDDGRIIDYFKIYDSYTNEEILYCKNDEICSIDTAEIKQQWIMKLKELLTTVPVYSSDEENLRKIISLFGYKNLITIISETEGKSIVDKSFIITGDEKGNKSEWYDKWYKDVFFKKLKIDLSKKDIETFRYTDKVKYEWIYDIEVFKYDWLFVAKSIDGKSKVVCWNDSDSLREWIGDKILIGFNNAAYDDPVIKHAIVYPYLEESALSVKEYSDSLIEEHETPYRAKFAAGVDSKKYSAPYFLSWDLSFHMPFDIRRNSLKKLTMSVLNRTNYDSSVPFNIGTKLSMKQRKEVELYCEMDVDNTRDLFLPDPKDIEAKKLNPKHEMREFARESYDIRWNLIVEYNMGAKTLINKSSSFAGKVLCGENAKPNIENTFKMVDGKKQYYGIPELAMKELAGTEVLDFYLKHQNNPFYISESFEYYMGGNDESHKYQFGFGGLHQALLNYGSESLVNMDVASLYPSLLVEYGLMSRGAANPKAYEDVYHTRLNAKREGKKLLNLGLKLILNGAIGAMLSKFNPLYDTWANSTICVHGQLLLFILAKRLYDAGFNIIQTNTDGIMIETKADKDYMEICEAWVKETRLVLEYDVIDILYQNNVNNYYCKFNNGKVKSKGFYLSNEKFGKATSKILCNMVTHKSPLEGTEPRDYVIYKKHSVGEIYDGITREKLDGRSLAFVIGYPNDPRTQEYYSRSRNAREVVKKDEKGKSVLDEFGNKVTEIINTESKITGFTEHMLLVDDVNTLTFDEINTSEYINFAKNLLNKVEDFGPFYNENFEKVEEITYLQALNPLKDNTASHPTNSGVVCQNFLFECDYLSKEEQEELIEKAKDYLYRVVWSGNRSYHCIVRLDEPVTFTNYRKIWPYLQYKLGFIGADEQCKMPSKYTRVPDQINPKTGNLQTLYLNDKHVLSKQEIFDSLPKLKDEKKTTYKFTGKITMANLERHIKRLDWSDGNRFAAVQKLSPALISQVTIEKLFEMIPVKLDKDHKYVIKSKYYYLEKYKDIILPENEESIQEEESND